MAVEIAPLDEAALAELGRFLADGFHAPADAEFAAADVLRWKYLDPRPEPGPRSFVARDGSGRIVGHVGIARTRFRGAGLKEGVPTLHMLDWLGSPAAPGVGAALFRRSHAQAPTQYGLGGSADARRTVVPTGYVLRDPVPVFRRVLRPRPRGRGGLARRVLLAGRDAVRAVVDRPRRPTVDVALRPVDRFGDEVDAVVARFDQPLLFPGRRPGELNAFLEYPRGGPAGYLVEHAGAVRGFAVLNVVRGGGARVGKVADLFLDGTEPALWHAAALAASAELRRLGADFALACGGVPWAAEAWGAAGFRRAFDLDFQVRDRKNLLPAGVPFSITFAEADYALIP